MTMCDTLGVLSSDALFADLYRPVGQYAEPPWRLALVTLMQCSEHLPDRQAAEAVRGRIDWKYAPERYPFNAGQHVGLKSDLQRSRHDT